MTRLVPLVMLSIAAFGQAAVEGAHGAAHRAVTHDEADHDHDDASPAALSAPSHSDIIIDHAEPEHPHAAQDRLRPPGADQVGPEPVVSVAIATPIIPRLRLPRGARPLPFQPPTAARPPTRAPPPGSLGFRPTFR